MLGDDELALRRPAVRGIGVRRQDGERQFEDARQDVSDAQASARDADDLIEAPSRLVNLQREAFDQCVVFAPADV